MRRVLIVEDDDLVRRVLLATLNQVALVVGVASADEAVLALEGGPFDAVLADTDLGAASETGHWLLAVVAVRWPEVRRILMSGRPQKTSERFLLKPIPLAELELALVGDAPRRSAAR